MNEREKLRVARVERERPSRRRENDFMRCYIFVVVDIILPLFLAAILSNGLGLSNPIIPQQYLAGERRS
jgi:hypothetical protein